MIIISSQNQSYFLKQRQMPPGPAGPSKTTLEVEINQTQSWLALDALRDPPPAYFFLCMILQLLLVPKTGLRMLVPLLVLEWTCRNKSLFRVNGRLGGSLFEFLVSLTKEHRNGLGTQLGSNFIRVRNKDSRASGETCLGFGPVYQRKTSTFLS